MRKKARLKEIKNSCGKKGCFISIRVLPYGGVRRKRSNIRQIIKAGIPIVTE